MGARFVAASEAEKGKKLATALVKRITGGSDLITARFLRQEFFSFKPTFKLWLATNHKPRITEFEASIWQRISLIPFEVTIPEAEQDKGLPEKIMQAEAEGVLAWLVQGCREWQAQGLNIPTEVVAATAAYRSEEDLVQNFLDERCHKADSARVQVGELWKGYEVWCEVQGEHAGSMRRFNERVSGLGLEKQAGAANKMFWQGVGLLAED